MTHIFRTVYSQIRSMPSGAERLSNRLWLFSSIGLWQIFATIQPVFLIWLKYRCNSKKRNMTMANSNDDVYIVVTDKRGEELLCPVDRVRNRSALTENELLNCFEKDVAERYSGNITIES